MRRRASATLAVTWLTFAASGCVGVVSRWDGGGPLAPSLTRTDERFQELGDGQGGVILRPARLDMTATIVTMTGRHAIAGAQDLRGSVLSGGAVYSLSEGTVRRRAIEAKGLGPAAIVATGADGARLLAVLDGARPGEETIAVATEDAVLVARRDGGDVPATRAIWEGNAGAIALDRERGAVWIAGTTPLQVLDVVRLEGTPLFRLPLPTDLDGADLRVVLSGRLGAVYGRDAPIAAALLVDPDGHRALPLAEPVVEPEWPTPPPPPPPDPDTIVVRGPPVAPEDPATVPPPVPEPGRYDDGSLPPLIVPPGRALGERRSLALEPARVLGRIAPFPGGRFLVVDDRPSRTLTLTVLRWEPSWPGPQRTPLAGPEDWRAVEGLGWDERGAVLTCGDRTLVVTPGGVVAHEARPVADTVRRGLNHGLNGVLVAGEVVSTAVLVAGIVAAIPPALVALPFVLLFR